MADYEYKITRHPADAFSHLIVFCTEKGECSLNKVPSEQTKVLETILNGEGAQGWELVQVSFGHDGILIFWKKIME